MANRTLMCNKCRRLSKEKDNVGGLSAGKAAAGATLAGPAGTIFGVAMGKTQRNRCSMFYAPG